MRAVAVGALVVAAVVAAVVMANQPGARKHPGVRRAVPARPPAVSASGAVVPADPPQLAADLNRAQAAIDDPASPSTRLSSAAWFEQLATLVLTRDGVATRRATLARLDPAAGATIQTNLAAGSALGRLVTPGKSLPPWKIIQPPLPNVLLGYFKAGQASSGIGWEYLTAIEFIETKFGRVVGVSTVGAEGPMQFLPSTWASYGTGDVRDPRDAVLGAARFLRAGGAPGDITAALYHYNPSPEYVSAVIDFANRMRADPRAYYGYYYQRVIYAETKGLVILPVGFPSAQPLRVP
jgi:hypothetical protein